MLAVAVVVAALALFGGVDSASSEARDIVGTWGSGDVKVQFTRTFTNDDGFVNDPKRDPYDQGTDPGYDKNVAKCMATLVSPEEIRISVLNGYPLYTCRFWAKVYNSGCRTLRRAAPAISAPTALSVWETDPWSTPNLNPWEYRWSGFAVRLEQAAGPRSTYPFMIQLRFTEAAGASAGCW